MKAAADKCGTVFAKRFKVYADRGIRQSNGYVGSAVGNIEMQLWHGGEKGFALRTSLY